MPAALPRDAICRRRRFCAETIELCVRWYITYRLSYRDLYAMMAERDLAVSHTTLMRWVQHLRMLAKAGDRPLWAEARHRPVGSVRLTLGGTSVNHRIAGGRIN